MLLTKRLQKKHRKKDIPKWGYVKARIRYFYEQAGIESCELEYKDFRDSQGRPVCTRGYKPYLTFAHSLKRKKIRCAEEMEEVIRACVSCHKKIEDMGPCPMYEIVIATINRRMRPVEKLYK